MRTAIVVAIVVACAGAARADDRIEVRGVTFEESGGTTRVHVHATKALQFSVYKLERPTRIVVDMPRARAEFAAAGLRTVPAPIALAGRDEDLAWELLPGISGLAASYRLLYEMAGELVRRIVSSVR